jgi:hypothetical protein
LPLLFRRCTAISQLIANSSISLSSCYQRDGEQLNGKDHMYFVVLSVIALFVALVVFATAFEYRLLTQNTIKTNEANVADDDDASSVCTQCSKCSSGRCSSLGMPLNSSLSNNRLIPDCLSVSNTSKHITIDSSLIENNNFLSHYQNGWCACDNGSSFKVNESKERSIESMYAAHPQSLCSNSSPLNAQNSRLIQLLANELTSIHSNVCSIANPVMASEVHCKQPEVESIRQSDVSMSGNSQAVQLLLCFSALNNSRRLFNVSSTGREDSIHCLHGIKFFCMIWIISGHSYSFAMQWLFFSK